MRFAICTFILISFLSLITSAEEKISSDQYDKMVNDNFETITRGMTPEMKERYLEQMEIAKKEFEKFQNLTPEEQKKTEEDNKRAMNDPNTQKRIKANFSNLPDKDKKILEIMIKNTNDQILEIKNPPLQKNTIENTPKREKVNIQPGTPNLIVIPEEKLAGLGNKDVKNLKEKYSALSLKTKAINEIEVNDYCSSELDCMSMSYGQQLNGGPAGFIVMSKNDINSKALMARINEFTQMEKDIQTNLKGFIQSGKPKEWPILECYQNECREKRQ